MQYNHKQIEKKWQDYWFENNIFKSKINTEKEKYYILDMFPYPSWAWLHVGHPEWYTATDILTRYKRMKWFNVLHPMWWDAYWLPAENYAIKTWTHPRISTDKNIETFKRQIKSIWFSYDWDREVDTTDSNYYKWTQWIFLKLFDKWLAYEAQMPINWCPSCKTWLANEEVVDWRCDRCKYQVEKKDMKQWMLKITEYAQRLLDDLDTLDDWPEPIKLMQRNWIWRSQWCEFIMKMAWDDSKQISVYTTRIDTVFWMTYAVIAPDHDKVLDFITKERARDCKKYIQISNNKSDLDRTWLEKDKTWVFTWSYLINPFNWKSVQLWIWDFVLWHYWSWAVMSVPWHDERDHSFAKKYWIEIVESISWWDILSWAYTKYWKLVNSWEYNWLNSMEAIEILTSYAIKNWFWEKKTNFKLRDWVFSRQRYWWEPIPIIHCEKCWMVWVPEKDLPVLLPEVEKYEPTWTGESPLVWIESWVNTKCPKCLGYAKRETNTMPQWAWSSWYYLRFMDPKNSKSFCSKENEKYWWPVDMYVWWAEHAVLHLLYSRFWHKVLYDLWYVSTIEPFKALRNQWMILAQDWQKMSKSLWNVINPDEVVDNYWADTLRMYEMFMWPFNQAVSWDTKWIMWVRRFLDKVWRLREKVSKSNNRVIIIHWFQGGLWDHWLPLLRNDLITKWYYVQTPSMPNPYNPNYKEWKKVLDFLKPDKNTTLVWHSLWWWFITRYLSDTWISVNSIVLVAPTNTGEFVNNWDKNYDKENIEFLIQVDQNIDKQFFQKPDFDLIKTHIWNSSLIYSDNEPFIKQDDFIEYKEKLGLNTFCISGAGHCWEDTKQEVLDHLSANVFTDDIKISDILKHLHKTIKRVGSHIEEFRFNTAISNMMILVNQLQKEKEIEANMFEDFLLILSPFAPHICEELWQSLWHVSLLSLKPWPLHREALCKEETLKIMIQINWKLRWSLEIELGADEKDVLNASRDVVSKFLVWKPLKKEIYVQGRVVNFVI